MSYGFSNLDRVMDAVSLDPFTLKVIGLFMAIGALYMIIRTIYMVLVKKERDYM